MIGQKLEQLLKTKGIKPGTLATMTGINKSTIYSIIKRNNKNVDYSTIEKIADALDTPVEYFHDKGGEDNPVPVPPVPEDDSLVEAFVDLFVQLNKDNKLAILAAMNAFLASQS